MPPYCRVALFFGITINRVSHGGYFLTISLLLKDELIECLLLYFNLRLVSYKITIACYDDLTSMGVYLCLKVS